MPTEDAYSFGHLVLSLLGLAFSLLVETSDTPYRLDILPVCDIITGFNITEPDISRNIGFHRAFATGVACRQGTLTPPDTWSCPTLGLASVLMLRPISPELVLFLDFWVSNIPRYFCFWFMPPDRMIGGILFLFCLFVCLSVCQFICLSVCLCVVNFNLRYNFWTVRGRDFIFGMHTLLIMTFQMTPSSMTLWPWL